MFLFKLTEVVQPQATPDHVQNFIDTLPIAFILLFFGCILLFLLLMLFVLDSGIKSVDYVRDQHDYDTPASHERGD